MTLTLHFAAFLLLSPLNQKDLSLPAASLTPPIMDIQIVIFFWCWFQFLVLIGFLSCYLSCIWFVFFFFNLSLIHVITLNSLYKKCFCFCHSGQIKKLNPKYFAIPCQYLYLSPLFKSVRTSFTFLLRLLYFSSLNDHHLQSRTLTGHIHLVVQLPRSISVIIKRSSLSFFFFFSVSID